VNDQDKAKLKVATYVVGFFFSSACGGFGNALDVSVVRDVRPRLRPSQRHYLFRLERSVTSVLKAVGP